MSKEQRRLRDYLQHVTQAIARIDRYTLGMSEADFYRSEMAQDAVIRNLEIIGEAGRNIVQQFPEFGERNPDLQLSAAYEMRNVLAHAYFKVDLQIVWRTLKSDLPGLRLRVEEALHRLDPEATGNEAGPS